MRLAVRFATQPLGNWSRTLAISTFRSDACNRARGIGGAETAAICGSSRSRCGWPSDSPHSRWGTGAARWRYPLSDLTRVIEREVLVGLKQPQFADLLGRDAAGRQIRHTAVGELEPHVGDIHFPI